MHQTQETQEERKRDRQEDDRRPPVNAKKMLTKRENLL